jgi:undecaprenyl diphosphate synthase
MNFPKHIAIIMDGNGRWAQKRFLPRASGHQKGVKAVRDIVKHCANNGVQTLTLFAFSSENINRSSEEVSLLFSLFLSVLKNETSRLDKNNVKLKIIGDMSLFSEEIQTKAVEALELLQDNTGLTLVIAANYGGRWDIAQASKRVTELCLAGKMDVNSITSDKLSSYLSLADEPAVDLLIRTSGELRLSNFLLWDVAYSELYFTDVLWPDFTTIELDRAIENFNTRDRRFGARKVKAC